MSKLKRLSALNRKETIKKMSTTEFDLVVIGGGITGAGIALDASSRGMKVALVEKNDFASGTSSRSTKLIHGGLRYLKQLEIRLVQEVGSERAIVHHLAPHLVTAEKMLLPLIEGGTYGKMATSFGLMIYDYLAGVEGEDKRVMLDRDETLKSEPLLKKAVVKGGGLYAEYRTDDARLTIENIKTAARFGAMSINYVKADDFIYKKNVVKGVQCTDLETNTSFALKSKYVISAAGPWVDKLRKKNNSLEGKHLFLSKGVHLVVPHEKLPVTQAVYFDIPDGRMMFAIPRHRVTYIGTTDTPYDGDINHVLTNMEDVDYLLNAVNNMFPKSTGGKLTGFRKMSERVVDLVAKQLTNETGQELKDCHTDKIVLTEETFLSAREVEDYTLFIEDKIKPMGLSSYYAKYLVANYGKQTDEIIAKLKDFDGEAELALARAELWFCVHNELTFSVMDFFTRRTGRLYFNIKSIAPVLDAILADMKDYLAWDDKRRKAEKKQLLVAVNEASTFEYAKVNA